MEEGVDPRGRGGVVASLPYAEAIKGEQRGRGGRSHDDFAGVEISIARGVGEMVCAIYSNRFFLFFFFSFFLFFF